MKINRYEMNAYFNQTVLVFKQTLFYLSNRMEKAERLVLRMQTDNAPQSAVSGGLLRGQQQPSRGQPNLQV